MMMNNRLCYLFIYLIGCTSVIIIAYCLVLHHIEGDRKVTTASSTHPIEKPRIAYAVLAADGDESVHHVPYLHPTNILLEKYNEHDVKTRLLRDKIQRLTANSFLGMHADEAEQQQQYSHSHRHQQSAAPQKNESTRHVHLFYSAPVRWTTNKNGTTIHLRTATDDTATETNLLEVHTLNSVFYPMLGLYTITTRILEQHCRNIEQLGTDVIVVGWRPTTPIEIIRHLLNYVKKYHERRLSIAIEIDLSSGDGPTTTTSRTGSVVDAVRDSFALFHREFIWSHPSLYRVFVQSKGASLPMVYVREAYAEPDAMEWAKLFKGTASIRGTNLDAVIIGHISSKKDTNLIRRGGFDGFYTRLASNGATYGSTWKNWDILKRMADKYHLIFIPTVGPGFNEKRKEPPAGGWRRHRSNGQYYGVAWRTAMSIDAQFVSIASYNDWPAGTQIEEAIPYAGYKDYQPTGPRKYLDLTRHWIQEYIKSKKVRHDANAADDVGAEEVVAGATSSVTCRELFNNTIC